MAYVRDLLLSRYSDLRYVLELSFDEFAELYEESLKSIRVDRLWIAYVNWQPEESFEQFIELENENKGVFIDQLGF